MIDNAQLLLQAVACTQTHTGFEHLTFRSAGELANQYTKIASSVCFDLKVNKHKQMHQGTLFFVYWETIVLQ